MSQHLVLAAKRLQPLRFWIRLLTPLFFLFVLQLAHIGKGTTFRIYFPRYIGDDRKKTVSRAAQTPPSHGETILLVGDEPAIIAMAQQMLQRLGYNVLSAGTPGHAIDLAKQHAGSVDLLFSDVVMPEMNGRELSKQIGTFYPELKTLFMSGYTADVIADHGVLEEGTNFIQKSFSSKDLGARIRSVLDDAGDGA